MRRESDYKPPRSLEHYLIGRPLSTADAPHQTIGKRVGLAVFASDALSSTAYATQEILGVLTVLGAAALGYIFPISITIVILLIIVTISYEQTIHAYPGGGGAYIVSRDNLGESYAQVAGADDVQTTLNYKVRGPPCQGERLRPQMTQITQIEMQTTKRTKATKAG